MPPRPTAQKPKRQKSQKETERSASRINYYNLKKSGAQKAAEKALHVQMSNQVFFVDGITDLKTVTNQYGTHTEARLQWTESYEPLAFLEMSVEQINGHLEKSGKPPLTKEQAKEVLGIPRYTAQENAMIDTYNGST